MPALPASEFAHHCVGRQVRHRESGQVMQVSARAHGGFRGWEVYGLVSGVSGLKCWSVYKVEVV